MTTFLSHKIWIYRSLICTMSLINSFKRFFHVYHNTATFNLLCFKSNICNICNIFRFNFSIITSSLFSTIGSMRLLSIHPIPASSLSSLTLCICTLSLLHSDITFKCLIQWELFLQMVISKNGIYNYAPTGFIETNRGRDLLVIG